jgi:hypothetical protein
MAEDQGNFKGKGISVVPELPWQRAEAERLRKAQEAPYQEIANVLGKPVLMPNFPVSAPPLTVYGLSEDIRISPATRR